LFLSDAGYDEKLDVQYYVTDLKFVGKDWVYMIENVE